MTGQRSGTIALIAVVVIYALLAGIWFTASSAAETPVPSPTVANTPTPEPPVVTRFPTGWQGRVPPPADGPTPGLLRPPFTLEPVVTATPAG
ncbi:MAG: hypothetical protein ACR2LS_06990 [Thermomicrobiales bacterium]|jgi:hypothetical protein